MGMVYVSFSQSWVAYQIAVRGTMKYCQVQAEPAVLVTHKLGLTFSTRVLVWTSLFGCLLVCEFGNYIHVGKKSTPSANSMVSHIRT